jgi:ankyrin repeat protein
MQNETCLLWISGYPGSGKTTLSAYVLEYLDAGQFSPSLRTTLCYFFCDEKIDAQRNGMAILRSLIYQLLVRRRLLIKHVKDAYDRYGPQFDQNFSELWRIFLAIANDKRVGTISVIVDAIDECEETTRERLLHDILDLISKSRSSSSSIPCIKFLLTSRPFFGRQYSTNLLQIDPSQNHVEQDLRLVIQTKVEGIVQRFHCSPDVQTYLENVLYSKSDRTFLWVTLVLRLLEKSLFASQNDYRRIIDGLPKTLTATYERFLHGISSEYQPVATRLLHFLVGSSRPLTLSEMRILMAIQEHHRTLAAVEEDAQPNIQETIEGVLGPLVRVWDSRIYLVHQSLKEFLQNLATQKENTLSEVYGIDQRRASLVLANICVSYLLLDDFKQDLFSPDQSSVTESPTSSDAISTEMEPIETFWDTFDLEEETLFKEPAVLEAEACISIRTRHPLFDYSARHWAEHFSVACSISPPQLQEFVIVLSDASSRQGLNWLRYYWHYAEPSLICPRDFSPLIVASYFGHATSLQSLLTALPIDSHVGATSLYWASRMGHCAAVEILLRKQVDPGAVIIDGQNTLTAAVKFDRPGVVKQLLKDERFMADKKEYGVNCQAIHGRTPLSIAAGSGIVEIVRLLLQHSQIQPDIADFDQWTPPFWSISGKHLNVLEMLVADDRVNVNHVDRSGRNILSWAASAGELELVKYLINLERLRAGETDRNGRTSLSWAAGNGHLETTIHLRRTQRIDLCQMDKDGRNALSWACSGCHYKVVEYLIKHDPKGADQEDVDGWTPLAWALFSQAPKTVQTLLDSGLVDVNKKDKGGRSALAWAANYGYSGVVEILLKTKGIEINSQDNDGLTPLASATRYPDVMKALQDAST